MPSAFSVVALLAAYNEADIIHHVVADLINQGIGVYFLDDGSTDDTVKIVEPFVGRGLLAIERLPARSTDTLAFDWERILLRKSDLAAKLEASWFIHHDADEFRESPWPRLSLRDAIERVDALGFNAIDFAGLDFWPVHDRFCPGTDVREAFTYYSELALYDRLQIRCWKKTESAVDLASSGGHEAKFPDRKVFPLRFILRHYPIRGQAHGERKVFKERRSQFLERERGRGWHVQYDETREGQSFLRDPSTLTAYDAESVRMTFALRDIETLETHMAASQLDLSRARADVEKLRAAIQHRTSELSSLREEMESQTAYVETLTRALDQKAAEIEQWRASVESLTQRLHEMQHSASWRWTAPARNMIRLLRGR